MGRARLVPDGNAVHVQVRACGFPPGFHGFRVLGVGLVDGGPAFAMAGGHDNPAGAPHAHHAGDLPSPLVKQDGTAELDFRKQCGGSGGGGR